MQSGPIHTQPQVSLLSLETLITLSLTYDREISVNNALISLEKQFQSKFAGLDYKMKRMECRFEQMGKNFGAM